MKRITNKNVLTVISILSVLLFFFGACFFALWGLYRLDLIALPNETEEEMIPAGDGDMSLPVHMPMEEVYVAATDTAVLDDLWGSMPFSNSYYVKITLDSYRELDPVMPEAGIYEIWRFGDRFQINQYSFENQVVKSITCDGTRVQIKNYKNATTEYKPFSADNNFDAFSPIPGFDDMTNRVYQAISHREENGVFTVYYEYDEGEVFEKIEIEMKTGIIKSFVRRYQGRIQLQFSAENSDFDFAFQDYMFDLD